MLRGGTRSASFDYCLFQNITIRNLIDLEASSFSGVSDLSWSIRHCLFSNIVGWTAVYSYSENIKSLDISDTTFDNVSSIYAVVYLSTSAVVQRCTFVNNGQEAPEFFVDVESNLTVSNNIVINSNTSASFVHVGGSGNVTSEGYNYFSGSSTSFPASTGTDKFNFTEQTLKLGSLQDNGGFTFTRALQSDLPPSTAATQISRVLVVSINVALVSLE